MVAQTLFEKTDTLQLKVGELENELLDISNAE